MRHSNSNFSYTAFLTQFQPQWAWIWISPLILSIFFWNLGRWMPWENIYLYPLQALLLTLPIWISSFWWIWTVLCTLFWRRHWWTIAVSLFFVFPFGSKKEEAEKNILVANVNAFTGNEAELQRYLEYLHVDYAILLERRADEIKGMQRAADDFSTPVKKKSHHAAIFCREDCRAWISEQIGSDELKMSYALLKIEPDICVIGIHAPPPVPVVATGMRPYINAISKYIQNGRVKADWQVCDKDDRAIVTGDMNAVAGSWPYQQLREKGLVDQARLLDRTGATWPSGGEVFVDFPFFRIDHLLRNEEITVPYFQRISIPDSDHKALLFGVNPLKD